MGGGAARSQPLFYASASSLSSVIGKICRNISLFDIWYFSFLRRLVFFFYLLPVLPAVTGCIYARRHVNMQKRVPANVCSFGMF